METDCSKHTHLRWKIKSRLENLGAPGIMGEMALNIFLFHYTQITRRMSYPERITELQKARVLHYRRRFSSRSNGSSTEEKSADPEVCNSVDEGIAELDGPSSVPVLLQILREKEQRIQTLEGDVLRVSYSAFQELLLLA